MDDLVNLDWSSAPITAPKTNQLPLLASSHKPSPITSTPSTFDFLSSAPKTGSPAYYSITPLRAATPTTATLNQTNTGNARLPASLSARATPVGNARPGANGVSNAVVPNSSSGDAFSNLLSLAPGPSSFSTQSKTLSLAERQAKLAQEKQEKEERDRQQFAGDGMFWEKFGGNAAASGGVIEGNGKSRQHQNLLQPVALAPSRLTAPNGILAPSPGVSPRPGGTSSKLSPSMGTFWDHDDLLSPASSSQPTKSSTPIIPAKPPVRSNVSTPLDPFDFDALSASAERLAPTPIRTANGTSNGHSGMRTPVSDFDFGDREEGRGSALGDDDDDDLLGDLGKPAKPSNTVKTKPESKGASRSTSPPPHIIGQIVEMGYTPQQARQALAKTTTGQDVEAAIEILLSMGDNRRDDDDFSEEDDDIIERERRRKEEEAERKRRRRAGPSRESVKARPEKEADQYAEHKELILEKAGEIKQWGLSTATSLWNSGKKILEEQRKALEASELAGRKGKGTVSDGRPRWAVADGAPRDDEGAWKDEKPSRGGFKDDDEPFGDQGSSRTNGRTRANSSPQRSNPPSNGKAKAQPAPREPGDLLFDDAPKASSSRQTPFEATNGRAAQQRPIRPRSPSAPLPSRTLVSASPAQLHTSGAKKTLGNEHFKLGRFTEAELSYSSAISSLPTGHLILIPLYNNRCATRLKLGDSPGAVSDATIVMEIIGPTYHPSKEAPLPPELLAEVKLADAMVKATIKRAQAWEMGEKWQSALEDWERVMGFDGVILGSTAGTTKNLAAEGARRARSMLSGGEKTNTNGIGSKAKPKPKPTPIPQKPANTDKSQAVAELRKANQAIEAEDAQKLAVKDSVDSKLLAWKGGKETNLRALIASLDTVLWEEMMKGGMKVGMHELITDKQVKIKYMKVIARLHPDKLNASNTNVEQRMLANGVFSALSDAWQAFNA